jgi:hypothetical protein
MIDREKVLTVLRRRFPGAGPQVLAAAANAIVGLPDEWEEVRVEPDVARRLSRGSGARVHPAPHEHVPDPEVRIFRRLSR